MLKKIILSFSNEKYSTNLNLKLIENLYIFKLFNFYIKELK